MKEHAKFVFTREQFRVFLSEHPAQVFTTGDCCICPVAMWIKAELKDRDPHRSPNVRVYPLRITIDGCDYSAPKWIDEFIKEFDTKHALGFIPMHRSGLTALHMLTKMLEKE